MKINLTKTVDNLKHSNLMSDKHQVIIGHSYSTDIEYINKWDNRNGGVYHNTVPFTIDLDGTIYQHFDPKYNTTITGYDVDVNLIGINLVNEGWLVRNDKNEYFNVFNSIYSRDVTPINMEWRGKEYWAPYTNKQMKSLNDLCQHICSEFKIPLTPMTHNTKVDGVYKFNGIAFKSNYTELLRDVSPAFDFNYFTEKLKEYETE